jgi:membrane-associated phospholipid phosphatase
MSARLSTLVSFNERLTRCGLPAVGFAVPVAATGLSIIWMSHTQLSLETSGLLNLVLTWLLLTAMSLSLAAASPMRPLPALIGSFCIILFGFVGVSLPSALGFVGARHLWDAEFLAIDQALGIDHAAFIQWAAANPLVAETLRFFYFKTALALFAVPGALVLLGRYDRLRELLQVFLLTITSIVAIAAFFPARGLFSAITLPAETLAMLPPQAGVFHLALVETLLAGGPVVYDVSANPGIIVFPSFHCCMALMIAYAFRGVSLLGAAASLWAAVVIVSTVPIGGHYVIDLAAGGAVFAAATRVIRLNQVNRRLEPLPVSLPAGSRA